MPRLRLPSVAEMTPEQREVHDEVVSGVRGQLIGPLRAVIHSPDLARRWSRLGEYLRFSTCLPKKLNELAIIVTGRRWNSQLEFHIHSEAAKAAGLDPACIEAIRVAPAAGLCRRSRGRGLRVRAHAAADRQRRRVAARRGDQALGRARRGRADRRDRLLHHGVDDAERPRNSAAGRREPAACAAAGRRAHDIAGLPDKQSRMSQHKDAAMAEAIVGWAKPRKRRAHVFAPRKNAWARR